MLNCKHCKQCLNGVHEFCACCGKCQHCDAIKAAPTVNPPQFVPVPYPVPMQPWWQQPAPYVYPSWWDGTTAPDLHFITTNTTGCAS